MLGGAAQDRNQLVVAERLLDVIERALVNGLHCRLEGRLGRHENDRTIRIALFGGSQDLDAGDVRHANVGEHDIRCHRQQLLQAALPALGEERREALVAEQNVERIEDS